MLASLSQNMPTTQVTYRNDKAVVVRVYVEKPREKRSSSSIQHHQHHYHIHHTVVHGSAASSSSSSSSSKGYDRRSGLLRYSRLLRDSARGSASSTPSQMASFKKKPKYAGRPAWFGNWRQLIPSFLRSWSNKKKKQTHGGFLGNGIKKLQVRRGKGFISKVFSTTCKCA